MSAASAPAGTTALSAFLRSSATYWGAMLLVGILNLGFSLVSARSLGPEAYGSFAAIVALVNIFLIAAGAATRTVTAVVATVDDRPTGRWLLRHGTLWLVLAGVVGMAVVGALAHPIAAVLHLDRPAWIWIAAVSLVPGLAGAATTGVLQGLRLFGEAGGVNLAAAAAKFGVLLLLLGVGWGVTGGTLATLVEVTAVWLFAPAVLGRVLRGVRAADAPPAIDYRGLLALPASLTIARLLFFNLDILIARHYLGPHDAGLFAALGVTGRIIAYGTGALPPVIYPYLVRYRQDPRLAGKCLLLCLAATAVAGGGAIGVFHLAPGPIVAVLFGGAFAAITPYLGWYGLAFLLYSLVYVVLHYLLAVESWWLWAYAVGGGLLELGALALFHHGIAQLTAVEAAFFGLMFVLTAVQAGVRLWGPARAPVAAAL